MTSIPMVFHIYIYFFLQSLLFFVIKCLILQSKFQFNLNLYLNENSYIVSLNILTNNSTCNLANISSSENLIYKIPLNLHFNDLGPQYEREFFCHEKKGMCFFCSFLDQIFNIFLTNLNVKKKQN